MIAKRMRKKVLKDISLSSLIKLMVTVWVITGILAGFVIFSYCFIFPEYTYTNTISEAEEIIKVRREIRTVIALAVGAWVISVIIGFVSALVSYLPLKFFLQETQGIIITGRWEEAK